MPPAGIPATPAGSSGFDSRHAHEAALLQPAGWPEVIMAYVHDQTCPRCGHRSAEILALLEAGGLDLMCRVCGKGWVADPLLDAWLAA